MRRWLPLYFVLAFLVGCGGGGGSTTSTVPNTGGAGGAPTSGPTASGSPSHAPSPGASPSMVPSGVPSSSPTHAPTAAPPTVAPTASPDTAVPAWNGQTIDTSYDTPQPTVNGTVPFTQPYDDLPTGGQGANFTTSDGNSMQCLPEMSNNYHIHVFVGIYYNGQEIILPRGLGIIWPDPPSTIGYNASEPPAQEIPEGTSCFYFTHTHDSTGIVHVEYTDPNDVAVTQPVFTIGDFFQVWGITVNQNQFGPYQGPVTVFTSGQTYRGGSNCSGTAPPAGTPIGPPITPESDLTLWTGGPTTVPLYSHEVIWYLIGNPYPTSLPDVHFELEC